MKFDVQISYEAYKSTMGILNFYMNLVQNGVRLHSFMEKESLQLNVQTLNLLSDEPEQRAI